MYTKQITQAGVNSYVAEVREALEDEFAAHGGSPFVLSPNRSGWHARCQECLEGFTETGGATVGTLRRHALKHVEA